MDYLFEKKLGDEILGIECINTMNFQSMLF